MSAHDEVKNGRGGLLIFSYVLFYCIHVMPPVHSFFFIELRQTMYVSKEEGVVDFF